MLKATNLPFSKMLDLQSQSETREGGPKLKEKSPTVKVETAKIKSENDTTIKLEPAIKQEPTVKKEPTAKEEPTVKNEPTLKEEPMVKEEHIVKEETAGALKDNQVVYFIDLTLSDDEDEPNILTPSPKRDIIQHKQYITDESPTQSSAQGLKRTFNSPEHNYTALVDTKIEAKDETRYPKVQTPRRLNPVNKAWIQKFKARQTSPESQVARRRPRRIAKKPLNPPKLSGGRKYKSRRELYGLQGIQRPLEVKLSQLGGRNLSPSTSFSSSTVPLTAPTFLKPLNRIVHIALGPHVFTIYLDFLNWWAPKLAEICSSFPETGPVTPSLLRDVDVDVFGLFIQWIYSQSLLNKHGQPAYQHRCISLWVLAKRLDIIQLKNDAINTLHKRWQMEGCFQTKALTYIHQNTTKDDMLRRYAIEVCRRQMPVFLKETIDRMFPPALLDEINEAESGGHGREDLEAEIDISKFQIVEDVSMGDIGMSSYA